MKKEQEFYFNGDIIRKKRLEKNWTLKEFGRIINMNGEHLGRIERGLVDPGAYTLYKIWSALGFSLDELVIKVSEEE